MPEMSSEGALDLCMHWQTKICDKRVADKGDEQETSISGRKTTARTDVNCWLLFFLCMCMYIHWWWSCLL